MDPEKVNYHYCDDLNTVPLPKKSRVLVTGANGYVAHRLIPELAARGYSVRCMFRARRSPPILSHPNLEVVYADCLKKEELWPALEGIEYAYYLIHSMREKGSRFAERDKIAAMNFVEVAKAFGVKKIIYLGGLGETTERLSTHLSSRWEVGKILADSALNVVRLRAAIIIGSGSASYELLKSLVLRQRWIPFLSEFNSRCQPIAIRDVIKYLVGVLETPDLPADVYPIGGEDVLTYRDLILRFAAILQREVRFFDISWAPLPVDLLCRTYAVWLHFFTPVPVNIATLLLGSLRSDVVCKSGEIKKYLPFATLDFQTAVKWALEKEAQSRVFSHWSDVPPEGMSDLLPLSEYESAEFLIDEHSLEIPAASDKVFSLIARIGGHHGWFHANLLWRIRGLLDRMMGGVGLHRGRRDVQNLRVGDSVDFFRVERLEPGKELLLRSEMISPGYSWLQFELEPVPANGTRLTLRAHFIPYPFWGELYWNVLLKFHAFIFKGLLRYFRREAIKLKNGGQPEGLGYGSGLKTS
ncbi:MAG: SDR family oxidoreductase [Nitrospinae bacterium]|nr:SDR family oxidoreductase [Nitrospinota bacterium]